jgi:hypothetical protein
MGPKKQGGGKKQAEPAENGGELTAEAKAKFFMLTCQSLQVQLGIFLLDKYFSRTITCFELAERSEEAAKALAAKREYQERVEQISKDFEEEKRTTYIITQNMTKQYKGMEEELLSRVRFCYLLNVLLIYRVFID